MNKIILKDFRCFHGEQSARLAPLTLLVGENSTGKTSFMAMARTLCDAACALWTPNFKEAPYDLGSFDEIAHSRGARGSQAATFSAGFEAPLKDGKKTLSGNGSYHFLITFGKKGTNPVLVERHLSHGKLSINEKFSVSGQPLALQVQTSRGSWRLKKIKNGRVKLIPSTRFLPIPYNEFILAAGSSPKKPDKGFFVPINGSPDFSEKDAKLLEKFAFSGSHLLNDRPFASAPVRSKPLRTYDPSNLTQDPEGDYAPMYLADIYFRDNEKWKELKERLENFGEISGLFNEISIRPLGKGDSEPFQIQIRKFGGGLKGRQRNLIDMGYGVSQVLPLITELLRPKAQDMFLLQQPEVHLHPSSQAALGTLFCQIASQKRQLIVETHSDYLLDRVRMDIRDKETSLRPEDVSILFFERQNALDVKIHSIQLDKEGNIEGAPSSYREFFLKETRRSIGIK